jgi:hypothetical protein
MVLAVLAIALTWTSSLCATWRINPDGTGDVPDIRTGTVAASNGDTLLLADGVYTGDGNTEISYGGKAIVIRSESGDPHRCVIDCEADDIVWRRAFLFFSGEGPASALDGVTVMNGYGYEGSAVWCWASSPTIANVIIRRNVATFNGGGLYAGGGARPNVRNATFVGNSAAQGAAVFCGPNSAVTLSKTIIALNRQGGSAVAQDLTGLIYFDCCDIYGNVGGDWFGGIADQAGVRGNISEHPLFCMDENPESPYSLHLDSPCLRACTSDPDYMGALGLGCGVPSIEARVRLEPRVINQLARGRHLTCYIELPRSHDPNFIQVPTVRLNSTVEALEEPTEVDDHDQNGVAELMVKFVRSRVLQVIEGTGQVEIEVTGMVENMEFSGLDTVRVLDKSDRKLRQPVDVAADDVRLRSLVGDAGSGAGVKIEFHVPEPCHVRLGVYDILGRSVRALVDEERPSGNHTVNWDTRNAYDARVRPGVYFVSLEAGRRITTGKIVIAR